MKNVIKIVTISTLLTGYVFASSADKYSIPSDSIVENANVRPSSGKQSGINLRLMMLNKYIYIKNNKEHEGQFGTATAMANNKINNHLFNIWLSLLKEKCSLSKDEKEHLYIFETKPKWCKSFADGFIGKKKDSAITKDSTVGFDDKGIYIDNKLVEKYSDIKIKKESEILSDNN